MKEKQKERVSFEKRSQLIRSAFERIDKATTKLLYKTLEYHAMIYIAKNRKFKNGDVVRFIPKYGEPCVSNKRVCGAYQVRGAIYYCFLELDGTQPKDISFAYFLEYNLELVKKLQR